MHIRTGTYVHTYGSCTAVYLHLRVYNLRTYVKDMVYNDVFLFPHIFTIFSLQIPEV